ncbi:MAG: ABC transporter permease [Acidimicrobiia bacterium]
MLLYAVRRLLWSIPVVVIASILVFVAVKASTDPGRLVGAGVTVADATRFREELGLNEPAVQQYLRWAGNFVHGDLGHTLTNQPVWPELRDSLVVTLQLGVFAFLLTVTIGLGIGIFSALKQYSWFDSVGTGVAFFGVSIPQFFFALMLQFVFVLKFKEWFGASPFFVSGLDSAGAGGGPRLAFSYDRLMHLVLPALTVAVQGIAVYSRYMRASMLDVLNSDYLRTARAKGISERRVITHHALRNAFIPVVTYAALDLGLLIGGLVVTEQVFEIHGMGYYFIRAYRAGEYVQVLPWMMIVVLSVIVFNLLADVAYSVLDPRSRLG